MCISLCTDSSLVSTEAKSEKGFLLIIIYWNCIENAAGFLVAWSRRQKLQPKTGQSHSQIMASKIKEKYRNYLTASKRQYKYSGKRKTRVALDIYNAFGTAKSSTAATSKFLNYQFLNCFAFQIYSSFVGDSCNPSDSGYNPPVEIVSTPLTAIAVNSSPNPSLGHDHPQPL